jgi:hypothetical protein
MIFKWGHYLKTWCYVCDGTMLHIIIILNVAEEQVYCLHSVKDTDPLSTETHSKFMPFYSHLIFSIQNLKLTHKLGWDGGLNWSRPQLYIWWYSLTNNTDYKSYVFFLTKPCQQTTITYNVSKQKTTIPQQYHYKITQSIVLF